MDNIKVNDILEVTDNIKGVKTQGINYTLTKHTILKVLGVSENQKVIVVSKYYCDDGHVFSITDDNFNNLKRIASDVVFDINDVLRCKVTFMAYSSTDDGRALRSVLQNELVVIRSINRYGEYNATIISGACKGEHIRFYIDTAYEYFSKVANSLDYTKEDIENIEEEIYKVTPKHTNDFRKPYKPTVFKYGDRVVYYKTLVDNNKVCFAKLGETYRFVAYCKKPIYTKRAVGIPLDCVLQTDTKEVVLANSSCLKPYKQNNCYVKHDFVIKTKGNKIKFVDKVNGTINRVGESKCKDNDWFNIKTGLLLAIARAYKDTALEDFTLDKFKD